MSPQIEDILIRLKAKYGITKYELERIIDTQFKYTVDCMENSDLRSVKWMHLGKVRPSDYYEHKIKRDVKLAQKIQGDS